MKKKTFFIYSGYIWTKTLLGLTFSPFKSIRETFERPILVPVLFSPLIGVFILLLFGKVASFFIFVSGWVRELIAITLSTALISILFWQLLLLYLFGSFLIASWKKKMS